MPTPIEIPVIVPGADQSTRSMGQFDESVKKAETSTRSFSGATQAASEHLNTSGNAVNNLAKGHASSAQEIGKHTHEVREFGREIRKINPEIAEFIKASTSGFGAAIAATYLLQVAFEKISDSVTERFRKGQEEIKSFQEAVIKAEESSRASDEAHNKKDASGFKSAMQMQEGLEAVGGYGARNFTEELALSAKVPIDKVTKVAIEGFQNGMSRAEISKVVHGAALAEQTGHGSFEQIAGGAKNLLQSTQGRQTLTGTDAQAASGLINSGGIKEYNSEKASADREKSLQLQREQLHAFERANGKRLTAPHMGPGFVPEPGTSAADIYTQSSSQKGGTSEAIDNQRKRDAIKSVKDLESALWNGPKVLENDEKKEGVDDAYHGIKSSVEDYRAKNREVIDAVASKQRGYEDHAKTWGRFYKANEFENSFFMKDPTLPNPDPSFMKDPDVMKLRNERAQIKRAAQEVHPEVTNAIWEQIMGSLKSIDNKMGKVSEGASKK